MTKKTDAKAILDEHFLSVTPDEFIDNLQRYCPDLFASIATLSSGQPLTRKGKEDMAQIKLFEPRDVVLPLNAYLASALTGLTEEQRQLVFTLSDAINIVCSRFSIKVYEPRKQTDPVQHPHVEDTDVFWIDRTQVLSSDLLIVLCHYPSFGAGEELDFAFSALVPTILISHSNNRVSRMVTGIPSLKVHINYTDPEDLRAELQRCLEEIRPVLEQRKLAFSAYDTNIVGDRIRLRREELNLTREQVAESVKHITTQALQKIEESRDKISNPSLLQLREIATVLKTTVADLVEPDTGTHVIARLEEWITGQAAAREGTTFFAMSKKDRNRLIRRLLLRLMDSLEHEDAMDGNK